MTPGARLSAAVAVLDTVLAGAAAERALTGWARGARYAGSGDRAAVRSHVYSALRCRRSAAWRGGSEAGRGLILGLLRLQGIAPETVMDGQGHAPPPPGPGEAGRALDDAPQPVQADCPDWLWPRLGPEAFALMTAQRTRAPVFLRVNLARISRVAAQASLAAEGIVSRPASEVKTALEVTGNERKIQRSTAYLSGLVELQDAASQAAVLRLPLHPGQSVLDYCAGGGGKALAMAALADLRITAHDAAPRRMADLAPRAARAGAAISAATTAALAGLGPFDLVLVDAPCSGSGTWRRSPDAKWRLTPERLAELCALQPAILAEAAAHVAPGGTLAYATCSVLDQENAGSIARFVARQPEWGQHSSWTHRPGNQGDGFYLSLLRRN